MREITLPNLKRIMDSLGSSISINLHLNVLMDNPPNGHIGIRLNLFSLGYDHKYKEEILTASSEYTQIKGIQNFCDERTHLNILAQLFYRKDLLENFGKKVKIYDVLGQEVDFNKSPSGLYLGDNFSPLLDINLEDLQKKIEEDGIFCEEYTVLHLSRDQEQLLQSR